MRLVDADALKEISDRVGSVVSEDIDSMPTIEPKKGEWIKEMKEYNGPNFKVYEPEWHCSECGQAYNGAVAMNFINYCFNCGARMESE